MIHSTFYRLPKEKRDRILLAARREFIDHIYEKSSINRILENAKVPKGSFYQYFDDKSDLFCLCTSFVYEKILAARKKNGEKLLGSGMLRMKELGYEKGYQLFWEDLHAILEEEDFLLFHNMMKAPPAIRTYVQMTAASELIAPVFKEELKADPKVRKNIDYDYYAYILSLTEVIPADYGARTGRSLEDTVYLGFEYMRTIYDGITERASTESFLPS